MRARPTAGTHATRRPGEVTWLQGPPFSGAAVTLAALGPWPSGLPRGASLMLTLGCRGGRSAGQARASTLTPEGLRCCPHSGGEMRLRGSGRRWGHGTPRAVLRPPPLRTPAVGSAGSDTRLRALSTYWSAGHRPSASGRAGPQHWAAWQLEDTGRGSVGQELSAPGPPGLHPLPHTGGTTSPKARGGATLKTPTHTSKPQTQRPLFPRSPPAHPPCPSLCCCLTPATGGVCVWLHLTPRQHRARLKGDD